MYAKEYDAVRRGHTTAMYQLSKIFVVCQERTSLLSRQFQQTVVWSGLVGFFSPMHVMSRFAQTRDNTIPYIYVGQYPQRSLRRYVPSMIASMSDHVTLDNFAPVALY